MQESDKYSHAPAKAAVKDNTHTTPSYIRDTTPSHYTHLGTGDGAKFAELFPQMGVVNLFLQVLNVQVHPLEPLLALFAFGCIALRLLHCSAHVDLSVTRDFYLCPGLGKGLF